MKLTGKPLFAKEDLRQVLEATFQAFARNACFDGVLANGRVTKLALRRAIFAALDRVVPVTLASLTIAEPETLPNGDMVASCTISYQGLPQLFLCSVVTAPALRGVTAAALTRSSIVLKVEGRAGSAYLIDPLISSEIALIERHLAVQTAAIEEWRSRCRKQAHEIAERVHDDLDRVALRRTTRKHAAGSSVGEAERKELWRQLGLEKS